MPQHTCSIAVSVSHMIAAENSGIHAPQQAQLSHTRTHARNCSCDCDAHLHCSGQPGHLDTGVYVWPWLLCAVDDCACTGQNSSVVAPHAVTAAVTPRAASSCLPAALHSALQLFCYNSPFTVDCELLMQIINRAIAIVWQVATSYERSSPS